MVTNEMKKILKQKIALVRKSAFAVLTAMSPLGSLLLAVINAMCKELGDTARKYIFGGFVSIGVVFITIDVHRVLKNLFGIQNTTMPFPLSWLLSLGLTGLVFMILPVFYIMGESLEDIESDFEDSLEVARREKIKLGELDLNADGHILAVGTTGSGKTANILRFVERAVLDGEFCAILDGKGTTLDYSFYDVVIKLARISGRKIYIFNQTNCLRSDRYNPFLDCSATQIKDMLLAMSDWSEDFYKFLAASYWQVMASVLIDSGIAPTFTRLLRFSNPDELIMLANDAFKNRSITAERLSEVQSVVTGEEGRQAKIQATRFKVISQGDGGHLFGNEEDEGFNILKAYQENAICIFLVNPLSFGDFAKSAGRLILQDMKHLVSILQSDNRPYSDAGDTPLFVLDELGVYIDKSVVDLFNKTRESSIKVIAAVQTTVDIDDEDETTTQQIIENVQNFMFFRNNNSKGAEEVAGICGTQKKAMKTERTSFGIGSGESSNRYVEEYRIHPNDIKTLPTNEGIFYSKNTLEILRFKTVFVNTNVTEIKPENEKREPIAPPLQPDNHMNFRNASQFNDFDATQNTSIYQLENDDNDEKK